MDQQKGRLLERSRARARSPAPSTAHFLACNLETYRACQFPLHVVLPAPSALGLSHDHSLRVPNPDTDVMLETSVRAGSYAVSASTQRATWRFTACQRISPMPPAALCTLMF
jgi:hypothetical protein